MSNVIMGRSCTGIIHLLNKTPIEWFSKSQASFETATRCDTIVSDNIFDLRHTLRYLGVSLEGPSWMFRYKLAVVNSSTLPSAKFQKRAHLLNYHQVMEAKSWGIIKIFHMDGKDNPADILTKFCSSREGYELLKPLIF